MRARSRWIAAAIMCLTVGALLPLSANNAVANGFTGYDRKGTILGSNLVSITDQEFSLTCLAVPTSQGVDAYVFDLGMDVPEGSVATVKGSNEIGFYDLDLLFYDADCDLLGDASGSRANETAVLPAETRFVEAVAYMGVNTLAELTVTPPPPVADPAPSPSDDGEVIPSPEPTIIPVRGDYSQDPNDPLLDEQWGMDQIDAAEAWKEEQATGFGVTIGVVDSGLDLDHPDFACFPWKLAVLPGSDVGDGDDDPSVVDDGHGTHVAGIAGACTNNDEGVVGVAPDATIMPVKVWGRNDSDLDKVMADGINFATDNGAHVINLSIGPGPGESYIVSNYPLTEAALEHAWNEGVVIAAAAGNNSLPLCEYPALSRFVICVGATDSNGVKAFYSDLPNNVDQNSDEPGLEASVMAPGGQGTFCSSAVISTYPIGFESICGADGYEGLDGTSMASPHVAGLAALLYDRLGAVRSAANRDAIITAIVDTAVQMLGGPLPYNPLEGYGRIDALAAVRSLPPVPPTP